jgi:quinol-cytochrome oxidoreductase complex cytochrome b subunit
MRASIGIPETPGAPNLHGRRLWSFKPRSDRESGDAIVSNFILHWFPAKTAKSSMRWSYSFWLGTASAALFLLLILSGLPLMFLYIPSVERAYASIKDVEYVVTFGSWIRSVHRLSAHLMVVTVFLHLARVFLTGAYKNGAGRGQRREWNWVLGVAMLLVTLFLSFTGYLLPWDQLAFWAVTVGTNIAASIPWVGASIRELLIGGRAIEQPALIRFYALHVFVLPALLGVLFVYHMWRIRRDGGLASADHEALLAEQVEVQPTPTKTYTLLGVARGTAPTIRAITLEAPHRTVNATPDLARRAAIVTIGSIALISLLSVLIRSPLEAAANPLITPNPAKAPWYFLWLQEIVTDTTIHLGSFTVNGAFLGGVILPGILIVVLAAWPWLDRSSAASAGVWLPQERRLQNVVFVLVLLVIVALTIIGTFMRAPYWEFFWPWEAWPEVPARI